MKIEHEGKTCETEVGELEDGAVFFHGTRHPLTCDYYMRCEENTAIAFRGSSDGRILVVSLTSGHIGWDSPDRIVTRVDCTLVVT